MKNTFIGIRSCTFGQLGYNVVFTSRNKTRGEAFSKGLSARGVENTFLELDVTNEEAVKTVVEKAGTKYGKLGALVNNAGVALGSVLLADATAKDQKQMLDTNVMGVFYGMKYGVREMLKTGGIVSLASIAGHNGLLYTAQYCASKHVVVGLTKGAAIDELCDGLVMRYQL